VLDQDGPGAFRITALDGIEDCYRPSVAYRASFDAHRQSPARSKMILPANPPYRHARVKQVRPAASSRHRHRGANPMNRHGICRGHDGPATCLGSFLRLGPAPFTPERSAPGRFHPRRTALVQKRTAAAFT
jgi:hypothetical protein